MMKGNIKSILFAIFKADSVDEVRLRAVGFFR